MGQKLMEDNIIGSALAQEQASHYDPETNRCYVELDVHNADLSKGFDSTRYLYDGQTHEQLAFSSTKNGKVDGMIFTPNRPKNVGQYDAAAMIDIVMADDRRR